MEQLGSFLKSNGLKNLESIDQRIQNLKNERNSATIFQGQNNEYDIPDLGTIDKRKIVYLNFKDSLEENLRSKTDVRGPSRERMIQEARTLGTQRDLLWEREQRIIRDIEQLRKDSAQSVYNGTSENFETKMELRRRTRQLKMLKEEIETEARILDQNLRALVNNRTHEIRPTLANLSYNQSQIYTSAPMFDLGSMKKKIRMDNESLLRKRDILNQTNLEDELLAPSEFERSKEELIDLKRALWVVGIDLVLGVFESISFEVELSRLGK